MSLDTYVRMYPEYGLGLLAPLLTVHPNSSGETASDPPKIQPGQYDNDVDTASQ